MEIYRRCDRESKVSYEELCKQLDQAFAETATEKARKFAGAKLDVHSETPSQFAINLKEKFLAWFRKANPKRELSLENMINHIVREKFLESLPDRLRVMIAQEEVLDLDEVAEFSDRYFEAQKNSRTSLDHKNQVSKVAVEKKNQPIRKPDQKREFKCFICKSPKHMAKHCPSHHTASAAVEAAGASSGTVLAPDNSVTPVVPGVTQMVPKQGEVLVTLSSNKSDKGVGGKRHYGNKKKNN